LSLHPPPTHRPLRQDVPAGQSAAEVQGPFGPDPGVFVLWVFQT